VLGISAWHLLRKLSTWSFSSASAQMATILRGDSASLSWGWSGTAGAAYGRIQPMKMAEAEGLFQSEDHAGLSLFTIGDWSSARRFSRIRIPGALSFLAYNALRRGARHLTDLQAEYEETYGPGNYIPPVAFSYWNFRVMFGAGLLMGVLALSALYLQLRGRAQPRWFLRVLVAAIALPYIAKTRPAGF
jgi:cytochrome d ubiquinol oxidase subunit I